MRKVVGWKHLLLVTLASLVLAGCGGDENDETVPALTLADFASPTPEMSVELSGGIEIGAELEVTVDTAAEASGLTVIDGSWSVIIENLQEGFNNITLKAVDGVGNIRLVRLTIQRDTTPPTVLRITPEGTDVPIGTQVTVTFSEAVKAETLAGNFVLTASFDNPVAGTITPAEGLASVAIFDPQSELAPGQTYTVTVTDGITDQMDLPLHLEDEQGQVLTTKSWTFTTGP